MNKQIPAVSIIIPMYNVEKYVGECLDSILNQTFTDYEVIVVDDCSTDKTCEVVESYLPKFNRGGVERLHLVRSEKNSGGAGTPRNTGLRFSRGKYLFFMDSDDAITETAIEELYDTAEKLNVDVLHCEKCYRAPGDTVTTDKNLLQVRPNEQVDFVTKPTIISRNLEDRINEFTTYKFWNAPWIHFFRRDFIMNNGIEFPKVKIGDDIIFNFYVICLAEDIARIPNVYYVWRENISSNTRAVLPVDKRINRYGSAILQAIGIFDDFTKKLKFFADHPEFKYAILNFFINDHINRLIPIYAQIPAHLLDPLIRRELSEVKDKTALTAFLFARMNLLNVQLIQAQNLLRQQPKEVQDFQRQNEIIQRQQAQIQELQQQLRNVHDVFR